MHIFYHDDKPGDCRLPHDSGIPLSLPHLSSLGIHYHTFPPAHPSSATQVSSLATARNYASRDEITVSPSAMGASYEDKIRSFYEEHMHEDEEIRYILKGSGYFDVRDTEDRWVRIKAEPGDLIILPAGIYHRFTVDEDNYINAMRLFQTQPKWAALNRSEETEANECRKNYVRARAAGFQG
ncbi:1,2-dihydroxy-3-keto-5-methylthiopentene dioxygenase [Imshaugia aleurites]|uniref:Acireductone dioxygenase n=1 Tax=Imshaugia aleurites TaxID=172621 RepID=A0A8H3I8T8_9LECA|nr:1,2-dihydroxy-3-keto-5-methylthiopentene dioxygenase [Imshaugia aleurites]